MLYPLRKEKNDSKGESEILRAPTTPQAQGTRMVAPQLQSVESGFAGPGCHHQGPWAKAAATAAASGSALVKLQQQGYSTEPWGDTAPSGGLGGEH